MIPTRAVLRSAALLLLALGACDSTPAAEPPPEFHGDRAWAFLRQQVAFGPRYPGGEGNNRQLAWLRTELGFRADSVIEQRFTFTPPGGSGRTGVNVFARFDPEAETRILLVANRDTRRRADGSPEPLDRRFPVPGANVNASGVALLLELAELFRQRRPSVGVDLLFTDADEFAAESRLHGIRHFLAERPEYRPRYAVVVQGIADLDPEIAMDEASVAAAPGAAGRLWAAAAAAGHGDVLVDRVVPARDGQAAVLISAGIPTVAVVEREYGADDSYWQAYNDLPDLLAQETLVAVGRSMTAFVYAETPDAEP